MAAIPAFKNAVLDLHFVLIKQYVAVCVTGNEFVRMS